MGSVVAALLAIIKALPAAESLFSQLLDAYTTWKIEQNLADETTKNARNAALIAAASGSRPSAPLPSGVHDLCAACPARLGRG
jgi:hypothetical protein